MGEEFAMRGPYTTDQLIVNRLIEYWSGLHKGTAHPLILYVHTVNLISPVRKVEATTCTDDANERAQRRIQRPPGDVAVAPGGLAGRCDCASADSAPAAQHGLSTARPKAG